MPGFSIVEFINEKTVEVVPSNWVVNDNICWWPASTGPKLRKQLANPDSQPDFTKGMGILYSVKILKTFDNYADAKKQLPDAELTSHLETETDDECIAKKSRKDRKRKYLEDFVDIRRQRYENEQESSDDDSTSLLTGLRKQNNMSESSVRFFDIPSSTPKKNLDQYTPNDQAVGLRKQNNMSESSVRFFDIPSSTPKSKNLDQDTPNDQAVGFAKSSGACSCEKTCCKILELKNMREEQKNMREEQSRFQEVILRKIVKLEGELSEARRILGNKENVPAVLDMPSFPCSTIEEIHSVESWLSNENNVTILIQHFASIGGSCVKDTSRRVLGRIFKGRVCSTINWTGKNGKYALGKTCLSKVIISSVRLCHQQSTEKEVEEVMKAWFRFCKDREGGREKRRPGVAETTTA